MADEIDQMQERNERLDALHPLRIVPVAQRISATGFCHYCDESVAPALLFCDTGCRDGWEHEQRAIKRNGDAR